MGSTGWLPWRFFVEWISEGEGALREIKRIVFSRRTRYQTVELFELAGLGLTLVIDGKAQSSISDEYWYHEALVHPTLLAHPNPRRVLILGGGEGATLREVLRHSTVEEAVMVDIDEEMVKIAREHLIEWHQGAFDDPRSEVVIADGRSFLEEAVGHGEKFDAVILDLVDPLEGGPAAKLYTLQFYQLVSKVLTTHGVVVTQATSPTNSPRVFAAIYHTMSRVFKVTVPYVTYVKAYNGMWGFMFASNVADPRQLTPQQVDELLRNRVRGDLKFYDGQTHTWMFNLPRPIRRVLEVYREVSTDEKPVTLPT